MDLLPWKPAVSQREIGSLQCTIVDPDPHPDVWRALVVLCHGFGAPGTDLVECAAVIGQLAPEIMSQTRFVFPAAPLQMGEPDYGDSRAWWMIDVQELNTMISTGRFRDLRQEVPEPLEALRGAMTESIGELTRAMQLGPDGVVLGGFSQGAMLSTDVALHLSGCGGLIVWSGTLLNEADWRRAAGRGTTFPVFQSHGRFDPILPFEGSRWLCEMLRESGFDVRYLPFDGMHEIPLPAMRGAAELIREVAARR